MHTTVSGHLYLADTRAFPEGVPLIQALTVFETRPFSNVVATKGLKFN